VAPLFDDVAAAIRSWKETGLDVVIYSSGSVEAQQLLFRYTSRGDLTSLVSGWFDTTNAGLKGDEGSYRKIAAALGVETGDIVFFSDSIAEIEASRAAGVHSALICRPGNPPVTEAIKGRLDAVEVLWEPKAVGAKRRWGRNGTDWVERWLM